MLKVIKIFFIKRESLQVSFWFSYGSFESIYTTRNIIHFVHIVTYAPFIYISIRFCVCNITAYFVCTRSPSILKPSRPKVCLFVCVSVCLSVYVFVCLSVCLFVCLWALCKQVSETAIGLFLFSSCHSNV